MPGLNKNVAGITEKRLKNRRFIKTEEAILKVFFEEDRYVDVIRIVKKAGVSRATFYRHHKAVRMILVDYEKYAMRRYDRLIYKLVRKKNMTMRMLYVRLLIFIVQNREVYSLVLKSADKRLVEKMVKRLQPKMVSFMRLPGNSEKIFDVYANEVVGLIWRWMERGMKDMEIEMVVRDIMFLTETARVRLSPLLD